MKKEQADIICPMITPFDGEKKPSREYLKIFLDDMRSFGVTKLFPLGSNGLFNLMTLETKKNFLKMMQEEAMDFEIMVGVGSQNTEEAVEMAKFSEDLGFTRIVLQPTYYNKAEQSWMIRHYEAVSNSFNGKIYIYSIPQLTNSRMDIETYTNIMDSTGKVEAIKESSGDIRYFNEVASNFSGKVKLYQGQDDLLLQSLIMGATGGVCGTTNINPMALEVYLSYVKGDIARAIKAQKQLNQFFRMVNEYPFPSMTYAVFYKKHNLKGKLPDPITTMEKIVEPKINEVINMAARTLEE
ncbi:dihydrodipicolinate synthase family protein [Cuniculiplasma sp. SKW3]|uniref:dihydrodipicolinate synthase family protein n=1 Tax=unclassified Cuniculiplasma TaxID=2619706 RepID=UPI003FD5D103